MVYVVFDLDETLANLNTVFYFLASLKSYSTNSNENLKSSINAAYNLFIKKVAEKEASSEPLGLLRPGILGVMQQLLDLQKKGKINAVVIYSNNGHLFNLEFVRDIIHEFLGISTLICDCIYWGTNGREKEYFSSRSPPGSSKKTWPVLKELLETGPCQAHAELKPEEVYFFDDQIHEIKTELKDHYVKVKQYNYLTPFDEIAKLYIEAINESGIVDTKEKEKSFLNLNNYKCHAIKIRGKPLECNINTFIKRMKIQQKENGFAGSVPPEPDENIIEMMALFNTMSQEGGKRNSSKTRKRRKHQKKSRRNNRS